MSNTATGSDVAAWSAAPNLEELEHRVQRLEDVVAMLCDTKGLEERVRARVLDQLQTVRLQAKPVDEPAPIVAPAPQTANTVFNAQIAPANDQPVVPESLLPVPSLLRPENLAGLTLLGEIWWELRTLFRMMRDPLYTLSWMARLPFLMIIGFLLWHYLFGFIFYIVEVLVLVTITYVSFKMFGRELQRYDDFTRRRRRR